ncbi:ArsR/SmtB family transcription factor [Kineosporia succinea]|uniref:DNA-binding transcriptional ArsR family regulator n=1 Tax=Kineosporia succinea TaxID=84632 RepID=A0ABT9P7G7_9ACTN|nr:helix-turn-helix domain-containing protein [Kineosporia succinea]MDP9828637.1 DNA-binding transcriptional ArsR family regulator [Kineosporia succinea]
MSSTYTHPDVAELTLPSVLFALSDPVRLEIVGQLAAWQAGEVPLVCASVGPEMPKSTRSHHLKVLREAGVTRSVQSGRERQLSLRREDLDARWPGLLTAVLSGVSEPIEA